MIIENVKSFSTNKMQITFSISALCCHFLLLEIIMGKFLSFVREIGKWIWRLAKESHFDDMKIFILKEYKVNVDKKVLQTLNK